MMNRLPLWSVAVAVLFLAACETIDFENPEQQLVVESYQISGEPLQSIRLSRTEDIQTTYDFHRLAVRNAKVEVQLLAEDGSTEATYPFDELDVSPGVYWPTTEAVIQPLRKYRLEVNTLDGELLTAQTVVPDTFRLVNANADSILYQGTDQLELTVTRSFLPNQQNRFIFLTEALDPTIDNLTPFAADFLGDDPAPEDLADFASGSSPILNEANYDVNLDDTIVIRLPWLAVSFFGPNRLTASAIDDNLFDFISSYTIQQGGSTLSPGEIPNVTEHIEGGIGVFGSYAKVAQEVFIIRP